MKHVLFTLALSLSAAYTSAQTVYGALAIDRNNGFYYGWAYDYATLSGAENRAIKECKAKGGNCQVVLTWSGKGCAVYRTVPGDKGTAYGWGVAATQGQADIIATREALKRSNGVQPANYVWACNSVGEFEEIKNETANTNKEKNTPNDPKKNTEAIVAKSVRIGFQEWTAENLDVKTFSNGDPILQAKNWQEWIAYYKAGKPAYIQFDTQPYGGKLYNRHAVTDPRGLAPKGWHIPSKEEWLKLINYLGGSASALANLKSAAYWGHRPGKNRVGFNALPVGYYGGNAPEVGYFCNWWTTTIDGKYQVTIYATAYDTRDTIQPGTQDNSGCYVRCVKD